MNKLKQIIGILFPKRGKCTVCGKKTPLFHMSIIGQIPFYACKKHHKETSVCLGPDELYGGMNRMGLIWINNGEWVNT